MNLSLREKVIGFLVAIIALLGGGAYVTSFGSVTDGQAYTATTTDSTDASGSVSYQACTGACVIGAITVVQPATAGYVAVYNATTTATSTCTSSRSSTFCLQVAKVDGASDAVGFFPIEASADVGVVIETGAGFNGQYVVTYKK